MTVTKITDHAQQAQDRQSGWTSDKARIKALTEILGNQVQLLEDVGFEVLTNSILSAATGQILDEYGRILNHARGALTDDQYRLALRAVAAGYQSDATAIEVIQWASVLLDAAVRYAQYIPASYRLEYSVGTPISGDWEMRVLEILELFRTAGVAYQLVEGSTDGDGTFRFDSGPGFDGGKLARRVI